MTYLQELNIMLDYKTLPGMHGRAHLDEMVQQLEHLEKLLRAIKHFERKAATAFADSQEPSILGFDYHLHKYEICRACAGRLAQRFNHALIEMSL